MAGSNARRTSAGRPRHVASAQPNLAPRDQIVDVAARLFATRGFAATSTREIADGVGIRQASLYYHFSGKDEILGELLQRSIRPTVDKLEKLELLSAPEGEVSADVVLYVLALLDVDTLVGAPHNAGILTRLPEVQGADVFADFRLARDDLAAAYGRLGAKVEASLGRGDAEMAKSLRPMACLDLGTLLLQLVEVVISLRASGQAVSERVAGNIAGACLRVCGASADRVREAATAAPDVLATFASRLGHG